MLREENEQLLNQFERERQMRRNQDQVGSPQIGPQSSPSFSPPIH